MKKLWPSLPKASALHEKSGELIVAQNRAASYNYTPSGAMKPDLVLHGTEVKALREGKANIRDAYVDFKPLGWLVNAHIAQYMPGGPWNHEPLGTASFFSTKTKSTSGPAAPNPKV